MTDAVVIMRPGRQDETAEVDLPPVPRYDHLKAALLPLLDGMRLEHVAVLHDGRRADMFVGDESALQGLARNEAATKVYRNNWLTQHPDCDPETLPAVYGPAVLFSRIVWS